MTATQPDSLIRRLKVITVKVYGTSLPAQWDLGAVPKLMSQPCVNTMGLSLDTTTRRITVPHKTSFNVKGVLRYIPVSFGNSRTHLNFYLVEDPPLDIIIGLPTLEELQTCLDLSNQNWTVTMKKKTPVFDLDYD